MQTSYGDETGLWPWAMHQKAAGAATWRLGDATFARLLPFEPETVLVPAGPFLMGSKSREGIPEWETPEHCVTLPGYRIGKYPVTNRQYAEFVKQVKTQDSPQHAGWFLRRPPEEKPDCPVVGVSWRDACAYCEWLSQVTGCIYRLPSEAEWEKAARGDDGRRYPWGNLWVVGCANSASVDTMPVDACLAGAGAYGCLDMLGNAQEWTRTVWGCRVEAPDFRYPYVADDGREVESSADLRPQARLVHRGGSFKSQPHELRCAARGHADTSSKIAWRGLRVAMAL
jgi:formylglycine-generating enzyme required for sulfatase activity